mmetsp:Transcript_10833/g.15061  ORF Transcript_10833/g.15061 Transcript_10833/m.15061 type:complete len:291 (+) Transcript_10833:195-1067(+)
MRIMLSQRLPALRRRVQRTTAHLRPVANCTSHHPTPTAPPIKSGSPFQTLTRSFRGSGGASHRHRISVNGASQRGFASPSSSSSQNSANNSNLAFYLSGVALFTMGLSYAAVPLYQAFCQVTGYGGTVQQSKSDALEKMSGEQKGTRRIVVKFDAGTGIGMPWKFKPLQQEVQLVTGETVLAFYNAENPTDRAMTGVATYNVTPMKAGLYFNKVQCFCFHEQRLQPKENVDMPVFFFLDNEFQEDCRMDDINEITLSYTFFPVDDDDVEESSLTKAAPISLTSAKAQGSS